MNAKIFLMNCSRFYIVFASIRGVFDVFKAIWRCATRVAKLLKSHSIVLAAEKELREGVPVVERDRSNSRLCAADSSIYLHYSQLSSAPSHPDFRHSLLCCLTLNARLLASFLYGLSLIFDF